MELDERVIEAIHDTHDTVIQLKTVLLGANGDDGLVGDVKRTSKAIIVLNEKHNKLNKTLWTLIGILVGSGVLGGSLWGLLK